MKDTTYITTIQLNIEWYLKKNCHHRIDAINWELTEDGAHRLLLYVTEDPSVLLLIKDDLQDYIQEGWEARFERKLRKIAEDST